jgi:hypothetical protein
MKLARFHIWLFLIFVLSCINLSAQDNKLLKRSISLGFPENTLLGHVDNLLVQEDIVLAFNSSRVDLSEVIALPKRALQLDDLIRKLFYSHNIKLTASKNKVIINFLDAKAAETLTIKGYIRDKETGEALVGASIVETNKNSTTFSNESGFYSLTLPARKNNIIIHYLGYKSYYIDDIINSSLNISLEFDNEMDQIVIEGSVSDNFLLGSGSEKIDLAQTEGFQSTSGDNDLVRAVRISPKVQSGNEGQVGLYVRGGSPDQNLILFDGIPLYEVSHTAGFSSIFIEESIKDVDLITNGFPARYGGRLSSVMNVRLKEGNKSKFTGTAKFSLPAMKAHLEGPLFSPNTTFNVSGRISYVDKYLNQLIGDIITYDDIDLHYRDIVGKITHRFSPTSKLSLSYYDGQDNLSLYRSNSIQDSIGDLFETTSTNGVSWGSTVWNVTFTNVLSDKLQMAINVGGIEYKNESQAIFSVNSVVGGLATPQELVVKTHSGIEDQLVAVNLDYYYNDRHRLKFGGSWIHHQYNSALLGNDTITNDGNIFVFSEGNLTIADELSFYVEDTYRPHENWQFYGGFHFSGFNIGSERYRNTQPRFSTVFTPDSINRYTVSYSNMVQYVHLLVNPGVGIPSDFWVPTTELVEPESARQLSFGYSRKMGNSIELSLSGYTKTMNNVLEYSKPTDLFFGTVNADEPPRFKADPDWEKSVISGKSNSYGIEFQVRKTAGTFTGWISYALAKTDRQFEEINENTKFPYKYDRRHDLSMGIKYKINKNCSISANYAFGTGNAFSLALVGFESPFGIILINKGDRNNLRFPSFSHLDFQFNYKKEILGGAFTFNLGLYNAYNRKNAYYIYVYSSPIIKKFVSYKTSLFPILPNMSLGYSF